MMRGALCKKIKSLVAFLDSKVAVISKRIDSLRGVLHKINESAIQKVPSHDVDKDNFAEMSKLPRPLAITWRMDPVVGN